MCLRTWGNYGYSNQILIQTSRKYCSPKRKSTPPPPPESILNVRPWLKGHVLRVQRNNIICSNEYKSDNTSNLPSSCSWLHFHLCNQYSRSTKIKRKIVILNLFTNLLNLTLFMTWDWAENINVLRFYNETTDTRTAK